MSYTIPTVEPRQGQAGSSWFWDATYTSFPANESWELSYYLRGVEDADFLWGSVVSAGTGAVFEVRIPASTTSGLTAGAHRLIGRVTKSGEVHEVYNVPFLVLADPATAVNAKSFNRQMLEAIDAALIAGVDQSAGVQRLEINGRTIEYRTTADLQKMRSHHLYLATLEENPGARIDHLTEFVRG